MLNSDDPSFVQCKVPDGVCMHACVCASVRACVCVYVPACVYVYAFAGLIRCLDVIFLFLLLIRFSNSA